MGIKADEMKALMELLRQGWKNQHTGSSFDDFLKEEKIELELISTVTETPKVRKRIRLKKTTVIE